MVSHYRNHMLFLVRYGEIGLKSKPVRRRLRDRLITNIQDAFLNEGIECITSSEEGRIYVRTENEEGARRILSKTFGVVSSSPVAECSSKMEDVVEAVLRLFKDDLEKGGSFAVRARRSGIHPYSSQQLASEIGSSVLSAFDGLQVNLDSPDIEIHVEVRGPDGFVYRETIPGPGGLPLGSQGKVLGLVDGVSGMVSCWLMMKRGCKVFFASKEGNEQTQLLERWDPRPKSYSIQDEEEFYVLAEKLRVEGLVFSSDIDNLVFERRGDFARFYPVVGLSQGEIESMARRIELE